MSLTEQLTRHVGPFPLWVWGALAAGVVGGGIWLFRSGKLGGTAASDNGVTAASDGGLAAPSAGGYGGTSGDTGARPLGPGSGVNAPQPSGGAASPSPSSGGSGGTPAQPPPATAPVQQPTFAPMPASTNGTVPGPGQLTQGSVLRYPSASGPGSTVIAGPGVPFLPDVTSYPVTGPGTLTGPALPTTPLPASGRGSSGAVIDTGSIGQPA